jgi:hypothetical protein
MFGGALKPSGPQSDFSDQHVPKPAPECRARAFFVILVGRVMRVDPLKRGEHYAILRRDSRGPDQCLKVVDRKLGFGVST